METVLRGHLLRGSTQPLPEGYVGIVATQQQQQEQGSQESTRQWSVAERFTDLTYYNHDTSTSKTDPQRRCLDWLSVAKQVRAHKLLHTTVPWDTSLINYFAPQVHMPVTAADVQQQLELLLKA